MCRWSNWTLWVLEWRINNLKSNCIVKSKENDQIWNPKLNHELCCNCSNANHWWIIEWPCKSLKTKNSRNTESKLWINREVAPRSRSDVVSRIRLLGPRPWAKLHGHKVHYAVIWLICLVISFRPHRIVVHSFRSTSMVIGLVHAYRIEFQHFFLVIALNGFRCGFARFWVLICIWV